VLGHGFWRSEYGGDPAIVGRTIALNGKPFQIIGVSSASFFGVEIGLSAQVFVPLCANAVINGSEGTLNHRSLWWLRVMGRPKAGLGAEQVAARLKQLAPSIFAATVRPGTGAKTEAEYRARTFGVSAAAKGSSSLRNQYSRPLTVLMIVVGIVLLIACANVANLLLARATARRREIAVRLAIGAGRGRILRQLLTESLLLSGLGAMLGVLFALWGNRALVALLSTSTEPIWLDLSLDLRVLGFALLCALTTGLLFGIAPAWRSARVDPYAIIKANARSIVQGESRFGLGKALVAAQIALSLTLVMTGALLLGTFHRLSTVELGFNREGVLIATVNLRNAQLPEEQRSVQFQEMLERSRALPGVRTASVSNLTPISGSTWNENVVADGFTPRSDEDELIWMNEVSPAYFATMGTRLVYGRDFDARDVAGAPAVAVISESAARKFFAGRNPIGQHYRTRIGDELSPPIEVIGIVQDAKYRSLREPTEPLGFLAISQRGHGNSLSFELVSDRSPNALIAEFTALVMGLQPRASLTFATMERQLAESITRERLLALLSSFFGGLALLLAIIGLYGVISYNVARRRNEIGIRIALGSPGSGVLRLILGEVTRIVVVGLALGALITLASTRLISTLLYGVTPYDPRTLAVSALLLATVALGAGALPAIRAARMGPMSALRDE
jgi:putative ABC transport system permease protein